MTFFEAIGILFDSPPISLNRTTIQKAFSKKMKTVHPDLNPDLTKNSGFEISRIKEARDYLEKSPRISPITSWNQRKTPSGPEPSSIRNTHPRVHKSKGNTQTTKSPNEPLPNSQSWIPQRTLRFGQYLYYRKAITWKQLIEAILAQRSSRISFGEVAAELGFLKEEELLIIRKSTKPGMFFGEAGVELGLLTSQQVKKILHHQSLGSKPLGRVFVERGVISQEELHTYLWDFRVHNFRSRQSSSSS